MLKNLSNKYQKTKYLVIHRVSNRISKQGDRTISGIIKQLIMVSGLDDPKESLGGTHAC